MIRFVLKIFFIQITYLSSNNEDVEDQMLHRFISAFDDETTIINWKKAHNITNIYGEKTFKRVIKNVRDILPVINSEKYAAFKLLINNIYMDYKKIGYPYFETWASSKSLGRILRMNDNQNYSHFEEDDMTKFNEEYVDIYKNLVWLMNFLDLELVHKNLFSFGKSQYKCWINDKKDEDLTNSNTFDRSCKEQFDKNIDLSHDLIESILPVECDKPVYVLAHKEGFGQSRKCSGEGVKEFTLNKSISVCSQEMLNLRPLRCKGLNGWASNIRIEDYMVRPFLCDKVIAKTFIIYLHFYSEDKFEDTIYEIILTENNEYQITWAFPYSIIGSPKDYWLGKEVEDLPDEFVIIHKFGLIIEVGIEYSTVKSEDTENEGIETRLILLDCGHQLGLDLIDEFFAGGLYDPIKDEARCHICRKDVKILGSYNTVVYKYKEE